MNQQVAAADAAPNPDSDVPIDIPSVMHAVVLTGPGRENVTIRRVPVPSPQRMEVLCKVDSVYICGTDPHIVNGDYPGFWPKSYLFIPGHEWARTIVALGPDAATFEWRIDNRVAGTSHAGYGYCHNCVSGRYNLCENDGNEWRGHHQYGHYSLGAHAEYVVHSVRSVFKIPDALTLEQAAAIDSASIALHTVKRTEIRPGDTVAVIGPGPMGLMVLQCALAVGAGRVMMIGRGERLAKAVELGAEPIDYTVQDPVEAVRRSTDLRGVSATIECVGAPQTLHKAIEMVHKGWHVTVIGIPLEPAALPVQKLVLEEIDLQGVRANRGTCEEVLPLMVRGAVDVRPLITRRFPLEAFPEALDTFVHRKGGAIKVLIKP
jgi:L-iditol 2-dehydrogenase